MRRWFLSKYPHVSAEKFVTITNGYDEADLSACVPAPVEMFEILYTGVISAGNRNPRPVFAAIRYALDNKWLNEQDLQVTFLGSGSYGVSDQFQRDIDEFGLQRVVQVVEDRIPYQSALGRMAGADVVLVLSEPILDTPDIESEKAWSRLQVPAKVYECLGLNRPLLALVSDGAVPDVLSKTNMGKAVSPSDIPGIALALRELYINREKVTTERISDDARISAYSRKQLTRKLADELDLLTKTISA
jgi:hypothetical protein